MVGPDEQPLPLRRNSSKLPWGAIMSLGEQPCPMGRKGLKLPQGITMFIGEQICLKLCGTLTFLSEFVTSF